MEVFTQLLVHGSAIIRSKAARDVMDLRYVISQTFLASVNTFHFQIYIILTQANNAKLFHPVSLYALASICEVVSHLLIGCDT